MELFITHFSLLTGNGEISERFNSLIINFVKETIARHINIAKQQNAKVREAASEERLLDEQRKQQQQVLFFLGTRHYC